MGRQLGTDTAHRYGGFYAVLTAWCEGENSIQRGLPIKTIKRFIAGKGNASKNDVIGAVRGKISFPKDDNEVDTLALIT